jgi:PAS domain S-box-containing protein
MLAAEWLAQVGASYLGAARIPDTAALIRAFEDAPVCITIADMTLPGRPLMFANRAFESLTGYRRYMAIGQNCSFLQGPDTDPNALLEIRRAFAAAQVLDIVLLNYRKDGSAFRNALRLHPLRNAAGALVAYAGSQALAAG